MNEATTKSGYKKTKLGWVPDEWGVKKFGKAAKVIMGQSPNGNTYNENKNGVPLINGPTEFTERYPIKRQWTTEPTKLCKKDDILICVRGSSTGRINVSDGKYCIGRGVAALRSNENNNQDYLEYQLYHQLPRLLRLTSGSTFPNINSKNIRNLRVPLPPLPEQKKIAEILSTWDRAIETLEGLIAKKEELKKGLMQQLLTGKKRFPGFEGEWQEVRFKDVVKIDAKSLNSKTPSDYQFKYISLSDVEKGIIHTDLEVHEFKNAPSRAKRIVSEGDILMATVRPNLQAFAMVKKEHQDMIASTGFAVLTAKKDFNNRYLYHYLYSHHISSQIYALIVGSNYPAINSSDVKKLKIRVPTDQKEMNRIESFLTNLDNEIKSLKKKKELLTIQKKGLMQQLLTGKTRVKVEQEL